MLLGDIAPGIKCRNAGASWLTFDIPFESTEALERTVASGALNADMISSIYGVAAADVAIYVYPAACAIKITLPRENIAGGIDETDFDGAQQFTPLLDIEIA